MSDLVSKGSRNKIIKNNTVSKRSPNLYNKQNLKNLIDFTNSKIPLKLANSQAKLSEMDHPNRYVIDEFTIMSRNREGAQTTLERPILKESKTSKTKHVNPIIPIQNLDADVSESLDGIILDANQRMQNMSVFSTASPGSRRLKQKNKKSLQKDIVGNWSSNNYLDMDRIQRRKFIPNPCSDRRFEIT